jgi:ankyrin repeat protein
MRGRFFANIFVHFEPLGTYRKDHNDFKSEDVYQDEALESLEAGLPPYIIPGTIWESEWRDANPNGWRLLHNDMKAGIVSNNLRIVDNLYIQNQDSIHEVDKNGWSPLHEAARAGHVEIARYLCDRDVDMELRTSHGSGQTALEIALEIHGEESEIYQYLLEAGAEEEL